MRSARTKAIVKCAIERIRRNAAQSGRSIAKGVEVSKSSMQQILQNDLGLSAYKKQRVRGLTVAQK